MSELMEDVTLDILNHYNKSINQLVNQEFDGLYRTQLDKYENKFNTRVLTLEKEINSGKASGKDVSNLEERLNRMNESRQAKDRMIETRNEEVEQVRRRLADLKETNAPQEQLDAMQARLTEVKEHPNHQVKLSFSSQRDLVKFANDMDQYGIFGVAINQKVNHQWIFETDESFLNLIENYGKQYDIQIEEYQSYDIAKTRAYRQDMSDGFMTPMRFNLEQTEAGQSQKKVDDTMRKINQLLVSVELNSMELRQESRDALNRDCDVYVNLEARIEATTQEKYGEELKQVLSGKFPDDIGVIESRLHSVNVNHLTAEGLVSILSSAVPGESFSKEQVRAWMDQAYGNAEQKARKEEYTYESIRQTMEENGEVGTPEDKLDRMVEEELNRGVLDLAYKETLTLERPMVKKEAQSEFVNSFGLQPEQMTAAIAAFEDMWKIYSTTDAKLATNEENLGQIKDLLSQSKDFVATVTPLAGTAGLSVEEFVMTNFLTAKENGKEKAKEIVRTMMEEEEMVSLTKSYLHDGLSKSQKMDKKISNAIDGLTIGNLTEKGLKAHFHGVLEEKSLPNQKTLDLIKRNAIVNIKKNQVSRDRKANLIAKNGDNYEKAKERVTERILKEHPPYETQRLGKTALKNGTQLQDMKLKDTGKMIEKLSQIYGVNLAKIPKNKRNQAIIDLKFEIIKKYNIRLDRKLEINYTDLEKGRFRDKEGNKITQEELDFLKAESRNGQSHSNHFVMKKVGNHIMKTGDYSYLYDFVNLKNRCETIYRGVKAAGTEFQNIKRARENYLLKKKVAKNDIALPKKKQKHIKDYTKKSRRKKERKNSRIQAWRQKRAKKKEAWFQKRKEFAGKIPVIGKFLTWKENITEKIKKRIANAFFMKAYNGLMYVKRKLIFGLAGILGGLLLVILVLDLIGGALSAITGFFSKTDPKETVIYKLYQELNDMEEEWLNGYSADRLYWLKNSLHYGEERQSLYNYVYYNGNNNTEKHIQGLEVGSNKGSAWSNIDTIGVDGSDANNLYINPFQFYSGGNSIGFVPDDINALTKVDKYNTLTKSVTPMGNSMYTSNTKAILSMMDVMFKFDTTKWTDRNVCSLTGSPSKMSWDSFWTQAENGWNTISTNFLNIFRSAEDKKEPVHKTFTDYNSLELYCTNLFEASHDIQFDLTPHVYPINGSSTEKKCPVSGGCRTYDKFKYYIDTNNVVKAGIAGKDKYGTAKMLPIDTNFVSIKSDKNAINSSESACISTAITGSVSWYNAISKSACWDQSESTSLVNDGTANKGTIPLGTEGLTVYATDDYYYVTTTVKLPVSNKSQTLKFKILFNCDTNTNENSYTCNEYSTDKQKIDNTIKKVCGIDRYIVISKLKGEAAANSARSSAESTVDSCIKSKNASELFNKYAKAGLIIGFIPVGTTDCTTYSYDPTKHCMTKESLSFSTYSDYPSACVYSKIAIRDGGASEMTVGKYKFFIGSTSYAVKYKKNVRQWNCKGHTGCFCGGHIEVKADAQIYSFSEEQVGEQGDFTPIISSHISSCSTVQGRVSRYGLNLWLTNDGNKWRNETTGSDKAKYGAFTKSDDITHSTLKALENTKFPLKQEGYETQQMGAGANLFGVDNLNKYGKSMFPCKDVCDYDGWTKENMDLAILKFKANWYNLYKIDVGEALGTRQLIGSEIELLKQYLEEYYQSIGVSLTDVQKGVISKALVSVGRGNYSDDCEGHEYLAKKDTKTGKTCYKTTQTGFASYIMQMINKGDGSTYKKLISKNSYRYITYELLKKAAITPVGNYKNMRPGDVILTQSGRIAVYLGMVNSDLSLGNWKIKKNSPITVDCYYKLKDGKPTFYGNIYLRCNDGETTLAVKSFNLNNACYLKVQ